jgi:hypothetical protein
MIDLAAETPIPLAVACGLVPPARGGKRTHLSTILRWVLRGARSPSGEVVRLEACRIGSRWMTSREALQRFADRLTPRRADGDGVLATPRRTPGQGRRASDLAADALERAGI